MEILNGLAYVKNDYYSVIKVSQTKTHSLFESINAASFATPTTIGLHKFLLWIFDDCARVNDPCNDTFVMISWVVFFFHSIAWKYIIRRIHEKYNIRLNPWYMIQMFKKKIKDKIRSE